ncbi:hypothetical protein [Amycolatopsis sp. NPDC051071]|uniref:hypothetical protein n=1 Tax=Amycolatopsis sp. NPDC051071 TaxID=3154637 RepID=UPI00343F4666
MTRRLDRNGWVIAILPSGLPDRLANGAAAGVLSAFGAPFFTIAGGHGLRLDGLPGSDLDPAGFSGVALPSHLALLMLRPDTYGGRCSTVSDLRAALMLLDNDSMEKPVFHGARVEHLHGPGTPRVPFSTLDGGAAADGGWLRWAGKPPFDGHVAEHRSMLDGFARLLELTSQSSRLRRGDLVIAERHRVTAVDHREAGGRIAA